ncbi:MAG: class D beta-lactamase [Chitinophagaceae bacterium]|nr:class D beta-lactamase [Chitinophagaceae bacterium]MCZ2397709.1 class D beta-lactamase [Chitinophagales bacterium]
MKNLYYTSVLLFAVLSFSCTPNVAKIDNSLKKYFDSAQVTGTFALLNNQIGDVTVYNMEADTQRISPGNSFKIAATLIGIESSTIADSKSTLNVVGDSATASMTLMDAFQQDNFEYFKALIQKIGTDTISYWIDSLKYGNMVTDSVKPFWEDGSLTISPDEQLGLIYKVYFDKLPFKKYSQAILLELMLQEDNTLYRYNYTAAMSTSPKGDPLAWILGWIEENKHVYFFSCVVSSPDTSKDLKKTGLDIVKKILVDKGFFLGKK